MDAKLATAQERYKKKFDKSFQRTPKFFPEQNVQFERFPVQITESAWMTNAQPFEILPKTFSTIKII